MIRPMGEFTVSQRTKDGYFDGGELLRQWNLSGQEQRKMEVFLNSVSTCKFIEALIAEANEVGLGQNCPKIDNQVVKKSKVKEKGKAGRPKEEVSMAANLILSKESSESEIKRYFNAVLELSKSDNEFPINIDEV